MAKTERELVIDHVVEKEIKFNDTIDMAVYLAQDQKQTQPQLIDAKDYIKTVLAAGYKSAAAKQLFDDIKKSSEAAIKGKQKLEK